jgi:LuxR family transcriptional regulator, maltose regulon positive regulatory protein
MESSLASSRSLPFFNTSKIIPPRLTNILNRPRLIKLLEQNQDKKLILILGQAAQGKSTLAASYVNTGTIPSAWINLGPEESDPVNLFYLAAYSLQQVLTGIDFSPILMNPAVTTGPREEIPLYREWTHALFDQISTPVQVILDGLDRLLPEAPAYRFLQSMLEEVPSHVQLFMLSREMPPLEVQTLRMKQEAFVLTTEDLAFTLLETRNFLKNIRGLLLSSNMVKRIHKLTEGWVGGLILLCESLEQLPEKEREKSLASFLSEKFPGEIFRFFGEKIFSANPTRIQEFLMKSSIPNVLDPDILKDFAGIENAPEILEDLHHRNLFVQAVYDKEKGWTYRYHQLFRDFLQARFRSRFGPEQQAEAYLHLAGLYAGKGEQEEAVEYFLLGRDYPQAVAIMEKIGLDLVKSARVGDLARWLQVLPEEVVQANPWLLFYLFITRRYSGSPETTATLEKALTLFKQQQEVRGILLALAHLLELSIIGGRGSIPIMPLVEESEGLLESLTSEQYSYERALLLSHLGFAHFMRTGESYKGYLACRNAYTLARSLADISLQFFALLHAYVNLTAMGEFSEAFRLIKKVDKLLEEYPYPGPQTMHFLHMSFYYQLRGDLEEAHQVLQKAQELAEKHGLISLSLAALMQTIVFKTLSGSYQEAEALGHHVLNLTQSIGNFYFHAIVLTIMMLGFYRAGHYSKARETIEQARKLLSSPESLCLMHVKLCNTYDALISYHCRDREINEAELQEILDYFTNGSMLYFTMYCHLLLALVKEQKGKAAEATRHLAQGFQIAQEKGYYHHCWLSNEDLARTCALALELEVDEAADYAAWLLTTRLAPYAGPELERLSRHPHSKVARKAQELQRIVYRAAKPRIRIKTLGEFQVFRGETPIPEGDWEGYQPRILLKALISRGCYEVPKDLLEEDLWPGASPAGMENKFKINLHRLRKTLEPSQDKVFGPSYIHVKENLVSLDRELCQVDAEDFLSRCQQGKEQEKAGDVKKAMISLQESVDLYEGDFLAADLYVPWAEQKREELRRKVVNTLMRLAALEEKQGSLRRALEYYYRVVQVEPLLEEAYQRLMVLNARLGRRTAALQAFADCQKVLRTEYKIEPDQTTKAIYRKILEGANSNGAKKSS